MTKHKGVHPSPAPSASPRANPLLWGYGFGALLIFMGLLVLSIALGSALHSATRGVQTLTLPESRVVSLKEGLYIGLLPTSAKGPASSPGDVQVTITGENGVPVSETPFPPEAVQANQKIGASLFQADVPYDGRYRVEGRLAAGEGPVTVLLIHESLSRNPSDLLVGVILLVVLGGFGLYIILLTHRRSKALGK